MSEDKNNNTVAGAARATDSTDRLRSASLMLSSHKGVAEADVVSATEREERVSVAQDKMRENIERAGKEAAERRALEDSKNEYKQDVLERENKKAENARRERASALTEERLRRTKLIEEEKERYLEREREENKRISEGVLNLLAKINANKEICTAEDDEEKSDKQPVASSCESSLDGGADSSLKATITIDSCASRIIEDATSDDSMTIKIGSVVSDSACAGESMILNIGGVPANRVDPDAADSMVIEIGSPFAAQYATPGAHYANFDTGYDPIALTHSYTSAPPRVNFSGELRAAEERHYQRRREAVYAAAGIYAEELRLLAEEEARYAQEIAEIKAKRNEYSEWLSELGSRDPAFVEPIMTRAASARSSTEEEMYSEQHAHEYEKRHEEDLTDSRVREEELVREYDRYIEATERVGASVKTAKPSGEALPYSTRSAECARTEVAQDEPHYEELETGLFDGHRQEKEPYASEFGGYAPMPNYTKDPDVHAVREYEAEMLRRESAERKNLERGAQKLLKIDQKELEDADKAQHAYNDSGLDFYARSQLTKRVDKFFKEEAALVKRLKKIASEEAKAEHEEKTQLIVEKIAIAKELCEMSADVLGSCVYVGSKAKTGKHKRILSTYVEKYNLFCDEYEAATGRPLDRIDLSMIDDVMDGKIYRPIQNVYYHGMEDDSSHPGLTPEIERERRLETEDMLISEEYARFLEDGVHPELSANEKRAASKRRSERMSAVKRAAERDALLISLRTEYSITELEAKRDVLLYSFDMENVDRQKEIRQIEKQIDRLKNNERKSAALERADNSRYYYLTAVDASEEKIKNGARRERLEALRLRLDAHLSERESINERLIALYGGADGSLKKAKVARKTKNVRRKAAKSMHRRQRELARKIDKIKAPAEMKECAIELLNKRIADTAEYESARYTLKALDPQGRARDELIQRMNGARKRIASGEREIKYMIKRLEKHEERYRDEREWVGFLITLVVIAGLGIAAWAFFGDKVIAYFEELRAYFGF